MKKTKYELVEKFFSPSGNRANRVAFKKYLLYTDAQKVSDLYDNGLITKGKARKLISHYMDVRRAQLRKADRIRKGYE